MDIQEEFYHAWEFLSEHRIFVNKTLVPHFQSALSIDVVKVNPDTNEISEDDNENTKVQIWLECGPYEEAKDVLQPHIQGYTHDIDLDTAGDTFEEAIIRLAETVKVKYGK